MKKLFIIIILLFVNLCFADYLGSWKLGDYLTFTTNTHSPTTGAATDADSEPTYRIYEDETATPIVTGTMALLDADNTNGYYSEKIQLTSANGYEKGKSYNLRISAIVSSVTAAKNHNFQIEAEVDVNSSALLDTHTWYVAKTGGDGNGGHSLNDAYLTIAAAVTASASGDTIIIYPGTYDESVDLATATKSLKLIGTKRENCIINPTSTPAHGITLYDSCIIENLKVIGGLGGSYAGIYCASKSNINIINCHIEGMETGVYAVDGLYLDQSKNIIVRDSFIKSSFDALRITHCEGVVVEDCYLYSDGTNTGTSTTYHAFYGSQSGTLMQGTVVNNTIMVCSSATNENTNKLYVASVDNGTVFQNCRFYGKITGTSTGNVAGVYVPHLTTAVGRAVLENCIITTSSASGTAYDILTSGTSAVVSIFNTIYDTTKVSGTGKTYDYLRPTATVGATDGTYSLDVSATGEAGLNFDNIKDATGAHTLTNITVPATTAVTNAVTVGTNNDKTGYTVSTVSDKTGYSLSGSQTFNMTGDITGNLSGSVGSVTGAVGSVTGAVGSVTGSVGSVTGAVGSVTGGVTVTTNNDKTGYTVSTVSDKTGYSLSASQTFNMTGDITGNLSGSVGSVTGAVGSVTGAVGSVTGAVGSVTGSVGGDIAGKVLGGGSSTITGVGTFADVRSWLGTTVATPTVAGYPLIDVSKWKGTTVPTPSVAGYPLTDVAKYNGLAVTSTNGHPWVDVREITGNTGSATSLSYNVTYIDASIAAVKTQTDKMNFTGTDVKATLDSETVKLASDGLDSISITEPTGPASNFREMMVQVWRRFFKKTTATATQLKTYTDAGAVNTTQTISTGSGTTTVDTAN